MIPPIFATAAASSAVTTLLGTAPVRFFLFGEATQATAKPYAVWQRVAGTPENYLGTLPDIDNYYTQVDVYATTAASARAVADALRDAFEPVAHIVSWGAESKDQTTGTYRSSFDVSWWTPR